MAAASFTPSPAITTRPLRLHSSTNASLSSGAAAPMASPGAKPKVSATASTTSGESTRFGLAGITIVGGGAIEAIVAARSTEAAEGGPFTSLFDFCQRVLQRHWKLKCLHGSAEEPAHTSVAQHWKNFGPTDGVKAILISNAPAEG